MKLTFIQPATFVADWHRLGLTDDDLRWLESEIMDRPDVGRVMVGIGGLRKMRFAPPSRHTGKSDAMRICYLWLPERSHVYLMLIFPKNEMGNLSAAERNYFHKWVEYIRGQAENEDSQS